MKIEKKTIENDEPFLRQISKEVDFRKEDWKEAIEVLADYCRNDDNILAIASVQMGIPLRLVYVKKLELGNFYDDTNLEKIMINPKIIKREGLIRFWEACASCLDNTGLIERPYKIEIEYYDENQNIHHETYEGVPATVLSHEMDHLDGILHIDKALKILKLNKEERKALREKEPYEIIRKDGEFKK